MDPKLFSDEGLPLTSPEGGPPYASRAYSENPYPWYAWHRAHRPVLTTQSKDPYGGVRRRHYFFRHADVRTLLSDPKLGREAKSERAELAREAAPPAHRPVLDLAKTFFIFKDPPDHTRIRRAIQFLFDPSRLKPLEQETLRRGHRILDEVGTRLEFDVAADFAVPLVLGALEELIGVTCESHSQLHANALAVIATLGGGFDDARMRAGAEALRWFHEIVERSVVADAIDTRRGWANELVEALSKGSGLRADEVVTTLIFFLVAASDNTVNSVGNAVSLLCRYPECWRRLRENPELLPNAVAELLRLESPAQSTERYPLQPFDYAGIELRRGDTVILMLASANRDEKIFPNPEVLDFDRSRSIHATFGFGIHACPGALLARMLTTAALRVLTSRFESMACAEATFAWRPMVFFRGLEHLRVRGTAAPSTTC